MKRISLVLIAILISISAFALNKPGKTAVLKSTKTTVNKKKAKKPVQLYWYRVNSDIASSTVTNSDCTFINYGAGPSAGGCSGTNYYCIIGLTSSQVNTTTHQISGSQVPTSVNSWRGAAN